jgi:hypothetical protein
LKAIKKSIYILLLFFVALHVAGQKPKAQNRPTHDDRPLYFGFNIGLNTMDFGIEHTNRQSNDSAKLYPDVYRLQPGFHVSVVSNLRLHDYFDLRFLPGISFGQRDILFLDQYFNEAQYASQKITSSFIELPLLLKYKGKRINNFRPYLVSGANMRIDLAAKKKYDEKENVFIRLKPIDYYFEIGFGLDSYMPFFKLSTEIRYCIGLKDILVKDFEVSKPEYVRSIEQMHSRLILLSFYFE